MSEQEEDYEFTLNEKMHLSLNQFKKLMGRLFLILFGTLVLSGLIIWNTNDVLSFLNSDGSGNLPISEAEGIYLYVILIVIITVVMIAWYGIRGISILRDLGNLNNQFVRQSYLQNIETVRPVGKTREEKLLSQLTVVFPEVRKVFLGAEEGEEYYELEKKIGEIVYDIFIDTDEGDLLVEFFDKKITFEDIEKQVKNIKKKYKDDDKPFRLICVGKEFDDIFTKENLISKMDGLNRDFPMDLILEDEKGYSMVWID